MLSAGRRTAGAAFAPIPAQRAPDGLDLPRCQRARGPKRLQALTNDIASTRCSGRPHTPFIRRLCAQSSRRIVNALFALSGRTQTGVLQASFEYNLCRADWHGRRQRSLFDGATAV
jgi:hypothetical protein